MLLSKPPPPSPVLKRPRRRVPFASGQMFRHRLRRFAHALAHCLAWLLRLSDVCAFWSVARRLLPPPRPPPSACAVHAATTAAHPTEGPRHPTRPYPHRSRRRTPRRRPTPARARRAAQTAPTPLPLSPPLRHARRAESFAAPAATRSMARMRLSTRYPWFAWSPAQSDAKDR
eukprot:7387410-Prymnesium_polylepis.2